LALAGVLLFALLVRAVGLDQPIVENYVGRQVPTAMVARNLERGSGFLKPSLDVAPFPNRFLIEPPVYAAAVAAWRSVTGWPLGASGRFISALGVVLCAWGLYGLAARRSGRAVGLTAAAVFATFPVTLRYGRAFQPDALMLGSLLAGLRCWDASEAGGGRAWLASAFLATATALALKVLAAYALVPLLMVVTRDRRPRTVALVLATLAPALLWYSHAAALGAEGVGSRASADNGAIWLRSLDPSALVRPATLGHVVRFLGFRAFTPLGPWLALIGLIGWREGERLWLVWGASALAALAVVASKLHHEYYFLALAPVVAVGVAKALVGLAGQGGTSRRVAAALGLGLLALDAAASASTWRTPSEWRTLAEATDVVRARVPADAWLAAPEALLFAADRRGCRVEYSAAAARRAAGEWEGAPGSLGAEVRAVDGPAALVEFYRRRGARFFADVAPEATDPKRMALHEAVRRRYNVLVDRPGVLLVALDAPRDGDGALLSDGTRSR
jgi:hypothetical protein